MALVRLWKLLTRVKEIDNDSSDSPLKRCLNVFDLTSLGVGATVGAGLYVVTGQIARDVAGPAVVLSFFIAAVAAFLSGICYAEFGCRITKAGSAYIYTYTSIGEIWAFIIGWNMVLEYVIGTASLGRASSEYIDSICGGELHKFWIKHIGEWHVEGLGSYPDFIAFFLVIVVSMIVGLGAKHSAVFNKVVTGINMLVVVFVVVIGIFHVNPKNWVGDHQFLPYGVSGILAGAASCFYCFVGFDVIATASEETLNPRRSIPLSIMLSLIISFLAYFGVATILTLMVSYKDLDSIAPLPEAFKHIGLSWAKYIIAIGGLCALFGSLMSGIFAVPRILYSMSTDGLIFGWFARVYTRTNIPINALMAAGILSATLALCLDLKQLVEMLSIGTLLAYTLVSTSVLVLRFQPGVQSVVLDDEEADSKNSGYSVICCRPHVDEPQAIEYKAIGTGEDKADQVKHEGELPDTRSSQIATTSVVLMITSMIGLVALLLGGWSSLNNHEGWSLFALIFTLLLFVFGFVVMMTQPRNHAVFPFTVPCIPVIPLTSILVNLFLLLKLSKWTWIRFGVWMTLGFAIYIFYGIRHSVEGLSDDDPDGGSTHAEYIVNDSPPPTFNQKIKPVQPKQSTKGDKAPLQDSFQDTPAEETAMEAGNE